MRDSMTVAYPRRLLFLGVALLVALVGLTVFTLAGCTAPAVGVSPRTNMPSTDATLFADQEADRADGILTPAREGQYNAAREANAGRQAQREASIPFFAGLLNLIPGGQAASLLAVPFMTALVSSGKKS